MKAIMFSKALRNQAGITPGHGMLIGCDANGEVYFKTTTSFSDHTFTIACYKARQCVYVYLGALVFKLNIEVPPGRKSAKYMVTQSGDGYFKIEGLKIKS